MKLAGRMASILLADGGKQILELASIHAESGQVVSVSIEESEDLGLWIRVEREERDHLFLLRWEYILGIDVPLGLGKVVGWKG